MGSNSLSALPDEPLTVGHNDSTGQKYIYFPSKETDKPYSQVEPGQQVIPLVLPKEYGENYPEPLKVRQFLKQLIRATKLLESKALQYDIDQQNNEGKMSEVSETMTETHQKMQRLVNEINEEFAPLASENTQDTIEENYIESKIKGHFQPKIKEKYKELGEWQNKKEAEILKNLDAISHFTNKGHDIKVHFSNDSENIEVPLDSSQLSGVEHEEVRQLVEQLSDIYSEREEKFKAFMEELGFKHYMTEHNLGFHQFKYSEEGFEEVIVEVPMTMPESQEVEVYERK